MTSLVPKLLLLGLAGAAVAGTAVASPPDSDAPTVVVHYRTAELSNDNGVRALYHQLAKAAERVCENESTGAPLPTQGELKCREKALAGAIDRVHNERLAALYHNSSKSG
jgi:UrcA family protein